MIDFGTFLARFSSFLSRFRSFLHHSFANFFLLVPTSKNYDRYKNFGVSWYHSGQFVLVQKCSVCNGLKAIHFKIFGRYAASAPPNIRKSLREQPRAKKTQNSAKPPSGRRPNLLIGAKKKNKLPPGFSKHIPSPGICYIPCALPGTWYIIEIPFRVYSIMKTRPGPLSCFIPHTRPPFEGLCGRTHARSFAVHRAMHPKIRGLTLFSPLDSHTQ